MKWINRGHEFDEEGKRLSDIFRKKKSFMIFGAGLIGKRIQEIINVTGCMQGFIDNDSQKQGKKYCEYPVISFEEFKQNKEKSLVIIATDLKNIVNIKKQLWDIGLIENTDFFVWNHFEENIFPILFAYYFGKSYVNIAQISLTERCTLKCKKCAHGCFAVKNDFKDLTLEQIKYSADIFFRNVDCVKEFHLIGGEPLLYNFLDKVIAYIGGRYRKQIVHLCITTNGSIIPDESVLKLSEKYGVIFKISNYSKQIPRLQEQYTKLVQLLDSYNIDYELYSSDDTWIDYGFEYIIRNKDEKELINVFDQCKTPCREIRENRYYYCVMARSVSENLKYNVGLNDYLDLNKISRKNYSKIMLEFSMGFSEKGYLDMCARCNGREAYIHKIPAAEQI